MIAKKPDYISLIVCLAVALLALVGKARSGSSAPSQEGSQEPSSLFSRRTSSAEMPSEAAAGEEFVKGLDKSLLVGADAASLSFSRGGTQYALSAMRTGGSLSVNIEGGSAGKQEVFSAGALTLPSRVGYSYPKIGFSGGSELPGTSYMLGAHDFTGDREPDPVIAVSDGGDGFALFVLDLIGGKWTPVGEIVTRGKGLGGARVFRQAVTLKDAGGTMYSWTCHGSTFDYLASDHGTDPSVLF